MLSKNEKRHSTEEILTKIPSSKKGEVHKTILSNALLYQPTERMEDKVLSHTWLGTGILSRKLNDKPGFTAILAKSPTCIFSSVILTKLSGEKHFL